MSFLENLCDELDRRCYENENYSLRAFARDLKIDPSKLSKVMAGKIKPRKSTQRKLLLGAGFNLIKIEQILNSDEPMNSQIKKFQKMQTKEFEMISSWYHFAILELTRLSFFRASEEWIASILDIPVIKTKMAVKRLRELGYLEIDESGKWHDRLGDITTNLNVNYTNEALRLHQLSLLDKSRKTIQSNSIEERSHTSTMFAIDKRDLEQVKHRIHKFRSELSEFLEREDIAPNHLYQLQVAFFPLVNLKGAK